MTSTPPDISQLHISASSHEFDAFNDHQQPKTFHYASPPPPATLNPQFQYAPVTMGQQGLKKPARAGLPSVSATAYFVRDRPHKMTDTLPRDCSIGLMVIILKTQMEIVHRLLHLGVTICLPAPVLRRLHSLTYSHRNSTAALGSTLLVKQLAWEETTRSYRLRLSSRTFLSLFVVKPFSTSS